jgi:four helix bundle protein
MATLRRFEDLQTWQKGRELVRTSSRIGVRSDSGKDYGLKDQWTAVSGMRNIAEECARPSARDFVRFLTVDRSSARLRHA